MRFSIGRKLMAGFLSLALLVLIAGLVGIIVLQKVSTSADTVAKEKSPTQYAVMNAALSLDAAQKYTFRLIGASFELDEIVQHINENMDEFEMWITMLQHGTTSEKFQADHAHGIYKSLGLDIAVPQSSEEMSPIIAAIINEFENLKIKNNELVEAQKKKISYGVRLDNKLIGLPDFLNMVQRHYLDWTKQLKDAVNIETTFTGNTDPNKGVMGIWLHSYQVPNEELMKLIGDLQEQHDKMLTMAQKINDLETFKKKQRALNRGIGTTAKIERYFVELHKLSNDIYQGLESTNKEKQVELTSVVNDINSQLQNLITIASKEMQTALGEAATAKKSGVTILIAITIIAVLVAAFLGTIVSRFLSSRIHSIADSTKKIAEGNLQEDLHISSNDELGDLAHDTNTMIGNLRSMIGQILSFSDNLTQSAENLSGVSSNLDSNAKELSDKSHAAAGATATMNTSMVDISTLANDSMQRVQNVANATEEMSSTIAEIAQNTEQARTVTSGAVTTVENTSLKMNELSEAATEIGKVADVIVSIAEQTNLLSLNATIEAARAGEAGKGFAVVANEVKELAGQTNSATEDIRQKIAAIQQSSDMAIAETAEIAQVINDINSIVVMIAGAVEEQANTTSLITEDINSVTEGIAGMAQHVDSAKDISDSVASDINLVNETSKNIAEGSQNVQENATKLEELATELNRIVGQFKL